MLNAADENVLVAVDACKFERTVATVGGVTRFTKPRLQWREAETLLESLRAEGYIRRHDGRRDHATHYELTERGDTYIAELVARDAE